jgi:hypothetical protein
MFLKVAKHSPVNPNTTGMLCLGSAIVLQDVTEVFIGSSHLIRDFVFFFTDIYLKL